MAKKLEKILQEGDVIRFTAPLRIKEDKDLFHHIIEVDSHCGELSKVTGLYVVEKTEMTGGGYGHGPNDYYPDALHVRSRKLGKNKKYDPQGPVIKFTQDTHCYCTAVQNDEMELVGRMALQYVKFEEFEENQGDKK